MKAVEAIEQVNRRRPNAFSQYDLMMFLNELEAMVQSEVFDKSGEDFTPVSYGDTAELTIKAPYHTAYIHFICARMGQTDQEYDTYTNDMQAFNQVYDDYKRYKWRSRKNKSIKVRNYK